MGRASDPKEKRGERKEANRLRRNAARGGGTAACWADADAMGIANLVCIATLVGGSVQFGTTRDGGALSLTVYLDGERETEYVRPTDDVDALVDEWCGEFTRILQEDIERGKSPPPDHVDAVLRRFGA